MNILLQPPAVKSETAPHIRLRGVGWSGYEKILEALAEVHVRVSYDRGDVELMSPLPIHEAVKVWINQFITIVSMELDIPFKCMGSTTIRRRDVDRGLEPDECFYFASASNVGDWCMLDLNRDPPPDLALEVEITRSFVDRMGIYAALGVPEVWRFEGELLRGYGLDTDGSYRELEYSLSLPFLPIAELTPLLEQALRQTGDDRQRLKFIQDWCQQRGLHLKQSWEASQTSERSSGS
jgi:Uma2 family endonuclease